jgi:hypothetical protein
MEDVEGQAGRFRGSEEEGRGAAGQDPRTTFRQVSSIAVCMSYDLIDKLRWFEKETLKLSDEEINERLPHVTGFLDQLRDAYLGFSDVDL